MGGARCNWRWCSCGRRHCRSCLQAGQSSRKEKWLTLRSKGRAASGAPLSLDVSPHGRSSGGASRREVGACERGARRRRPLRRQGLPWGAWQPLPSQLGGSSEVVAVLQVACIRQVAALVCGAQSVWSALQSAKRRVGRATGRRGMSAVLLGCASGSKGWRAGHASSRRAGRQSCWAGVGVVSRAVVACRLGVVSGGACWPVVQVATVWANPSIERTAVGKPPAAAHVER